MHSKFMAFLLAAGSASAAEPPDLPAWVRELRDTYATLSGYLVTYRATGKDSQVDVTMGMDEASRLAVTHMRGTMRGKEVESRLWNTPADRNFSDDGDQLKVCQGVYSEQASLRELDLILGLPSGGKPLAEFLMTPRFMMGPKSLEPACNLRHKDTPNWILDLAWSTPVESDAESVTVESRRYGLIKFSKKTGMMIRQSIKGEDGSERVVEMKEFRANPGEAGISAISANWDVSGAVESSRMRLTLLIREVVFQSLVDRVDRGEVDLAKLEQTLNRERELLRRFAAGLWDHADGHPQVEEIWTKVIDESRARLIEEWPGSETGQARVDAVDAHLSRAANRVEIREVIANRLAAHPKSSAGVAMAFRGKPAWGFAAKTQPGVAASSLVESTLVSCYFEAQMDRELAERWNR